ncbi:hypothetical protein N9995_00175, partial [bacterium]|nr:hypothetical protein [bacterium]
MENCVGGSGGQVEPCGRKGFFSIGGGLYSVTARRKGFGFPLDAQIWGNPTIYLPYVNFCGPYV